MKIKSKYLRAAGLVVQTALLAVVITFIRGERVVEKHTTSAVSIECGGSVCDTTWHYTVYENGMEHDYIVTRKDSQLDTVHFYILNKTK